MLKRFVFVVLVAGILVTSTSFAQDAYKKSNHQQVGDTHIMSESISGQKVACQNGSAGVYPCQQIDLLSFMDIQSLLGGLDAVSTVTNDIWGWTDPLSGTEYALVGMSGGTSFVDISDGINPVVIGFLPTHTSSSTWRDIKVYENHAFIVADNAGEHGIQIFDLTQLTSVADPPVVFEETVHYDGFGSAHNIVINEESGYAYAVGSNSAGETCGGGLHMINIQDPAIPVFEGCFSDPSTGIRRTGYSHDAQCVIYRGPDTEHQGKEICFGSNETALSIADVTDKNNPVSLSASSYPSVSYAHQGWLSSDHKYFFMDDELDEPSNFAMTRTIVWDVEDLDDPVVATEYFAQTPTRDHNQYVVGDLLFQSNYTSGVRILDIKDPVNPVELAFFDVLPDDQSYAFNGSWSNYPFFKSGKLIATSIDEGFFILEPSFLSSLSTDHEVPSVIKLDAPYPNPFTHNTEITMQLVKTQHVTLEVYDMLGRRIEVLFDDIISANSLHRVTFERGDLPAGEYIIRARGTDFSEVKTVTIVR